MQGASGSKDAVIGFNVGLEQTSVQYADTVLKRKGMVILEYRTVLFDNAPILK